jgi:hypothetical protein
MITLAKNAFMKTEVKWVARVTGNVYMVNLGCNQKEKKEKTGSMLHIQEMNIIPK